MNIRNRYVAVSCLALCSLSARADLLDFNDLTYTFDGVVPYQFVNPVLTSSYRVLTATDAPSDLFVWRKDDPAQADPGFAAVGVNNEFAPVFLSRVDGQAFDFQSIDLGSILNDNTSNTIQFTFTRAGANAPEVTTVTTDSSPGLQTFTFNEVGVSQVQWETIGGDDGFQQFDNINVTSAIPEPGEWALLLAGCALICVERSRRRRSKRHTLSIDRARP